MSRRRPGRAPPTHRPPPPSHAPVQAVDSDGVPYVVSSSGATSPPWHPSTETSLKLLSSVRLSAAVWSAVADCDETFNYWEPAHYFLYGKGFQTWEYSPEFALRSYLYVLTHAVPAWLFDRLTGSHRMYVFYFLRCLLSVACACCEVYFVSGIRKEVGINVARITLAASLLSCGMFHASPAFLPSSTSMCLTLLAYGAWCRRELKLAIFFTALSALLSWPFAALTGAPIAVDILLCRRRWLLFAKWSLLSAAAILLPMVAIDSQYYGRTVLAPLNIVAYNVFTDHGPDLYGVEDWKFYFLNGFLNFNVLFPLALAAWPLQFFAGLLVPAKQYAGDIPRWLLLSGLYLWLLVFTAQPHKEERFLFPAYPLVVLAAAVSVDSLQRLFFRLLVKVQNQHYLNRTNWISAAVLAASALASLSRVVAVYSNYSAPMNAWIHLSHLPLGEDFVRPAPEGEPVYVCIGKEWHRFPTSFFLPGDDWELKYLKSEFRGQLPQPYLKGENATRAVRDTFNDLNREEENRYELAGPEECHYLVDVDTGRETPLEPAYLRSDPQRWRALVSLPFLDAAASSSRLLRAFWVPWVSHKYCKYSEYQLLENRAPARRKEAKQDGRPTKKKKIKHL